LNNLFQIFDHNQVKILFLDDVKNNPEQFISEIYDFLEVKKDFIPPSLRDKTNKSTQIQSINYKQATINKNINRVNRLISFMPINVKRKIIYKLKKYNVLLYHKNRENVKVYSTLSDSFKKKLFQKYFAKDIEILENLLNTDLSRWKRKYSN
jgi:hypothetical protein